MEAIGIVAVREFGRDVVEGEANAFVNLYRDKPLVFPHHLDSGFSVCKVART
jgi:hypothetical protein